MSDVDATAVRLVLDNLSRAMQDLTRPRAEPAVDLVEATNAVSN